MLHETTVTCKIRSDSSWVAARVAWHRTEMAPREILGRARGFEFPAPKAKALRLIMHKTCRLDAMFLRTPSQERMHLCDAPGFDDVGFDRSGRRLVCPSKQVEIRKSRS